MNYGPILREWRKKRSLSQHHIGTMLNLSPSYVSMLELSTNHVTLARLEKIANLVGMSLGQFLSKACGEKTYQEGFKDATNIAAGFFKRVSEFDPENVELIMKSLDEQ